jgi:diguanylate cyclase (GGDEF)-like protein/PAS domain S-box-containing protein
MTSPFMSARDQALTGGPGLSALLEHLPDMVLVVDRMGLFRYVNHAWQECVGRTLEDVVGTSAIELIHPDDRGAAVEQLARATTGDAIVQSTNGLRILTAEGYRLMEITTANCLDDPEIQGLVACARDVSNRPTADADVELMRRRFEYAFDYSPFARAVVALDGEILRTNRRMADLSGYEPERLVGMRINELSHPDEVSTEASTATKVQNGELDSDTAERRLRRADGSDLWVRRTFWVVRDGNGAAQHVSLALFDISDLHEAEQRVGQLRDVLEASTELVFFTNPYGKIEYVNARATELLGLREGDTPNANLARYLAPESLELMTRELIERVDNHGIWKGELTLLTSAGTELPVTCTIQRHDDEDGEPSLVSAIAHDIQELKDTQRLLRHQATHDSLTMLPNRQLFHELGEQALARAEREGTAVAVLFLDLDRFKYVNDTHGHHVGDELLIEIAGRLRESVRRGDVLARFGGDEFIVVCEQPAGRSEMLELADRLIEATSREVVLGRITADVGVSIGIAIGAGGSVTIDNLLRDADAALYQAKERGRDRAVIFGSPMPMERPTVA